MKRLILLVSILLIALLAFFLLRKNANSTIDPKLKDFAIANPKIVTKILFSPNFGKGEFLLFEKDQDNNWWVSNQEKKKFEADTSMIQLLLNFVMKKVELKHPVGDSAKSEVIREITNKGTKAIFYDGDKEIKTVYVGSSTSNLLGTHMYLPGTERPCVVHVPGFQGYLSIYFNTQIINWKSKVVIHAPLEQIESVKVEWPKNPTESFEIKKNGNVFQGFDASGNVLSFSNNKMLAFADMFKNISHESGEMPSINKRTAQKDSLLKSVPYVIWTIKTKNGKNQVLKIWQMPVSSETYSPEFRTGEIKVYETEYFWGSANQSGEIWVLQDAVLKNKMKKKSDFR